MPSPFTFSTTKPLTSDALNLFPAFVQGQWAALLSVLGTLVPTGAPTTGWRLYQNGNEYFLTSNVATLNTGTLAITQDDATLASWAVRMTGASPFTLYYAGAGAGTLVEQLRLTNNAGLATSAVTPTDSGGLSLSGRAQTNSANRFRMFQSMARSQQSAGQSIPNTTNTALTLDTNTINTDGMWAAGNNTRLTAPLAGKYLIIGGVSFAVGPGAGGSITFRKNGTTFVGSSSPVTQSGSFVGVAEDIIALSATDYIEIIAFQNSGGAINTAGNYQCFGAMLYIGE